MKDKLFRIYTGITIVNFSSLIIGSLFAVIVSTWGVFNCYLIALLLINYTVYAGSVIAGIIIILGIIKAITTKQKKYISLIITNVIYVCGNLLVYMIFKG